MARQQMPDPYTAAQFRSLFDVCRDYAGLTGVMAEYDEAAESFIKTGKWAGYELVFSPIKGFHVGYRRI